MYQEFDKPIHYVALAERLDIGKVTAYEMLRLLEKRELVKSEFHLSAGEQGLGRSIVLFIGQGSQYLNMAGGVTINFSTFVGSHSEIAGSWFAFEGYRSLSTPSNCSLNQLFRSAERKTSCQVYKYN